jgi:hypothetical protein
MGQNTKLPAFLKIRVLIHVQRCAPTNLPPRGGSGPLLGGGAEDSGFATYTHMKGFLHLSYEFCFSVGASR